MIKINKLQNKSILNEFVPTNKIKEFNHKPVIIYQNTSFFFFKTYKEKEIWFLIEKNKDHYYYQWIKDPLKDNKKICVQIPSKKPLTIKDNRRDGLINKELIQKQDISPKEIYNFLNDLGLYLSENTTIFPKEKKQTPQKTKEEIQYTCFEDYPENIQKIAINICKSKNPLLAFKKGISSIHEGDDPEIELSILQHFTNRVSNSDPVHVRVGGGTDAGKSDLVLNCLKIIPERFQQDIQTLSSKSLYYDTNLQNDYNHIIINDFLDSPDAIGLIKVMTDNLMEKKQHKTVLDTKNGKEGITLEIPGKNIVIITAAKDINDAETNRRLLHLNPKENETHKNNVKKFLKETGITGIKNTDLIFTILQATYDYLTKNQIDVFNPWIDCMELENKGFTDIKMFINLVKARTLIFKEQRYQIDNNILLGSKEDVIEVTKLWNAISPMQQYKFSRKQVELLNLLEVYDPDDSFDPQGFCLNGKTYNELAEALEVNRNTIYSWINGYYNKEKQAGKPGLSELGFVLTKKRDSNNDKSPKLIYLNPNKIEFIESLKQGFNLVNLVEIELNIGFTISNPKNRVIELFLMYVNSTGKSLTEYVYKNPKLKKISKKIENDEDVYNLIKIVQEIILDVTNDSHEDTMTHIYNLLTTDLQQTPKTCKNPQINECTTKNYVKPNLNKINNNQNIKKELISIVFELLHYYSNGINKFEFRSKLLERFGWDDESHILDFEAQLLDENYIKFDTPRVNIIPTSKLADTSVKNDKEVL